MNRTRRELCETFMINMMYSAGPEFAAWSSGRDPANGYTTDSVFAPLAP